MKEKKDLDKRRNISCSYIEQFNTDKMVIFLYMVYKFSVISNKTLEKFCRYPQDVFKICYGIPNK